jgi:hypothetical protein
MRPVVVLTHLEGETGKTVRSNRFDVWHQLCRRPQDAGLAHQVPGGDDHMYDYWRGLSEFWDTDRTVVNVEHDVERSERLIVELLDCEHPLCTRPYPSYKTVNPALPHDETFGVIRHDHGAHPPIENITRWWSTGWKYIEDESVEWADWSVPGFVKIEARARTSPLERDCWNWIEHKVNASVSGRWHIHWPAISHDHKTRRGTEL